MGFLVIDLNRVVFVAGFQNGTFCIVAVFVFDLGRVDDHKPWVSLNKHSTRANVACCNAAKTYVCVILMYS